MEKEEAPWAQGQAPGSLFILDTSRYVARGILAMPPSKRYQPRQWDLTLRVLIGGHRGTLNKGLSVRLWREALAVNLNLVRTRITQGMSCPL